MTTKKELADRRFRSARFAVPRVVGVAQAPDNHNQVGYALRMPVWHDRSLPGSIEQRMLGEVFAQLLDNFGEPVTVRQLE